MTPLKTGQFFGETNDTTCLDGVTLTDTEYTHDKVDWHYHENAYFTLILEGKVLEGNKKETHHCPPGTLLFHNWQEAHYNIKPEGFTRGFHIEIEPVWFRNLQTDLKISEGSLNLCDPKTRIGAYQIFKESKLADANSQLTIHSLLISLLSQMNPQWEKEYHQTPAWVFWLRDLLNDAPSDNHTLHSLAQTAGIHPVHLSRDFSKYFHCNLSEYIRKIKVQKALCLLSDKKLTLTEIAFECGFADQSHFIRCFKAANGLKPLQFRKILFGSAC